MNNAPTKYKIIVGENKMDCGTWEADSELGAILALALDAGYDSIEDAAATCEQTVAEYIADHEVRGAE